MQVREKLARRAAEARLSLPETAFRGLEAYFELLQKWNHRISLTSLPVEEFADEAIDRLLVEPALAAGYLPDPHLCVLDIGSGGGSPAIPIKLAAPTIAMVMVESRNKKAAFLRESVRQLGLARTTVESSRFEELLVRPEFLRSADVVTLRAVKMSSARMACVEGLLKPGGLLFLFSSATQPAANAGSALVPFAVHTLLPHLGSRLEILRRKA